MHCKHRTVYNRAYRDVCKKLAECVVHGCAVLLLALDLEPVRARELEGLVVAAQEADVRRVLELEDEQQQDALDRVVPAVDVVPEEQEPVQAGVAGDGEDVQQIVELAVDVADDGDGALHLNEVGFCVEKLSGLVDDL